MMCFWKPTLATPTTSYSNSGGQGNRTALITVTGNFAPTAGAFANLVDGSTTANSTNALDPPVTLTSGMYFQFDFGTVKYIDELTLQWSGGTFLQGNWTVRGSNDAAGWSDFAVFSWGNVSTKVVTLTTVDPEGYRYYQIIALASGLWDSGWFTEATFKIAPGAT